MTLVQRIDQCSAASLPAVHSCPQPSGTAWCTGWHCAQARVCDVPVPPSGRMCGCSCRWGTGRLEPLPADSSPAAATCRLPLLPSAAAHRGRLEMKNFIMPPVGHSISLTRLVTDPTSRDNPDRQPGVIGDNLREVRWARAVVAAITYQSHLCSSCMATARGFLSQATSAVRLGMCWNVCCYCCCR
jgi:hypothetical protein